MVCTSLSLLVCPPPMAQKANLPLFLYSWNTGISPRPENSFLWFSSTSLTALQPCRTTMRLEPRCSVNTGPKRFASYRGQCTKWSRGQTGVSLLQTTLISYYCSCYSWRVQDFGGKVIFVQSVVERDSLHLKLLRLQGPFPPSRHNSLLCGCLISDNINHPICSQS